MLKVSVRPWNTITKSPTASFSKSCPAMSNWKSSVSVPSDRVPLRLRLPLVAVIVPVTV